MPIHTPIVSGRYRLLVIDVQEKLISPLIPGSAGSSSQHAFLIDAATVCKMPVQAPSNIRKDWAPPSRS